MSTLMTYERARFRETKITRYILSPVSRVTGQSFLTSRVGIPYEANDHVEANEIAVLRIRG